MLTVPLLRWLCLVSGALVAGHVTGLALEELGGFSREYGVLRQLNLNGEANLTAWFYSFLLLVCAVVAGTLACAARVSGPLARRWGVLAVVLLLMAVDEAAQLHDMANGPLRRALDLGFGAFYYAWLLPAVGVLALGVHYFAPLVRSLSPATSVRLVLAAALYFGGAVGFEMVSGFALAAGRESLLYQGVMTVEESLELAGILVLLATLLAVARRQGAALVLRFGDGEVALAPASGPESLPASEPAAEQEPPFGRRR